MSYDVLKLEISLKRTISWSNDDETLLPKTEEFQNAVMGFHSILVLPTTITLKNFEFLVHSHENVCSFISVQSLLCVSALPLKDVAGLLWDF